MASLEDQLGPRLTMNDWKLEFRTPTLQTIDVLFTVDPHSETPTRALRLHFADQTVPAPDVVPAVLGQLEARHGFYYDEQTRAFDWGATGPTLHEVSLWLSDAVLSGVTWDALKLAIVTALKALRSGPDDVDMYEGPIESADAAWERFERTLDATVESETRDLSACEYDADQEVWRVTARVDYRVARGTVSRDGMVIDFKLTNG